MVELGEMMRRHGQDGRVEWIGLRPARRAPMQAVEAVDATEAGLVGDHAPRGTRAVTLVQAEHLGVIGAMLGRGAVAPDDLRRNLVISGINLAACKRRLLRVGEAVLRVGSACAPCSRMEETLGHGGYSAVRGHGGWYAAVEVPGRIATGDRVGVVEDGGTGLT